MVARGTISSILCIINVKCTCKIMHRNVYILRHKHTNLIHGKDQHYIIFYSFNNDSKVQLELSL